MKLTLIVPNYKLIEGVEHMHYVYVPYNLCILAAMVEDICEVEIIDAYVDNLSEDELRDKLTQSLPNIVGITVFMNQFAEVGHRVARIVKEIDGGIITIMGGVYATTNVETAIKDKNLDYICMGEGEYFLRDFIKFFMGEKEKFPQKGIVYKLGQEIINTGRSDFIMDLDALPFPAYHLIDFKKYSNTVTRRNSVDSSRIFPYVRLYTSRGCPFGCSFCQVSLIAGRRFRFQSANKVIQEIKLLKEKYGINSVIFSDDNFFLNRQRVVRILNKIIEEKLNLSWMSEDTAVMHLDKELLELMRKSGCEYICCAIETGNERILNEIIDGKKFTKKHVLEMMSYAQKLGIFVAANFIIGFPTETWNEIRETIQFAELLNADYTRIFNLVPLKNTKIWDMCKNGGYLADVDLKTHWKAGLVKSSEYSLDDLTILRTFEWDRINFSDPQKRKKTAKWLRMTEEELNHIRQETREKMYASLLNERSALPEISHELKKYRRDIYETRFSCYKFTQ